MTVNGSALLVVDCSASGSDTGASSSSCEAANPVYSPKCKHTLHDGATTGNAGCRNPATGCLGISIGDTFVCD